MKWLILALSVLWAISTQAATVCVHLENNIVTSLANCGDQDSPAPTSIDTTDVRYTNFIGLQNIGAVVAGLLQVGINMTFTTTTAASDHYAATAAAIQSYQTTYLDKVTINASATFSVCTSPPATIALACPANPNATANAHTMAALAFKDLYADAKAYYAAVIAAQNTAVANGTAPVWPSNAYSSAH